MERDMNITDAYSRILRHSSGGIPTAREVARDLAESLRHDIRVRTQFRVL